MADEIVNLDAHYIGSPTPGVNLYQLPNAAMQVLEDVINATWSEGKATKAEFSAKIATALSGFLDVTAAPHVTTSTITSAGSEEPDVFIPANITPEDIIASFTTEYLALMTEYVTRGTTFMSTHFPSDASLGSTVSSTISGLLATTIDDITVGTMTGRTVAADSVSADSVTSGSVATSTASAPSVSEPSVYIPYSLDMSTILALYDDIYLEIVALLESKFLSFRSTWFANEGQVYESAEAWLLAALADSSVAMPPAVAAQIWGDDQARILSDKVRAQDAVVAQFASRGFPLPPDAAASAVLQIEQKAQDELAASSRKVAVMSVELMQGILEKALTLRVTSMQSANDFVKAIASAPDIASRIIGVGYDIQTKLISAVAALLGARAEVAKLSLTASTTNAQLTVEASKATIGYAMEASKATAGFALEASKSTAGYALEASKTTAQLGNEADKTNLTIAFEAAKANQLAKLEMLKVAIDKAVELRQIAISNLVAYVRDMASAAETSDRIVGTAYDAETKLISAASQFFNSRTQVAQMQNDVNRFNVTTALEAATKNQMADLTMIEAKLKALLAEAQAIAQMATALFNNLHVQVGLSANGGTTVSQSSEF